MDHAAPASPLSAHPADEIKLQRHAAVLLRTQLLNQGLGMPGCDAAYLAAHWITRDCELAWEAARRHQLVMLGEAIDIVPNARDDRACRQGLESAELQRRRAARQEQIDRVRALPNPFSVKQLLEGCEILTGNADLERAA